MYNNTLEAVSILVPGLMWILVGFEHLDETDSIFDHVHLANT